jgi:hypothetical protein
MIFSVAQEPVLALGISLLRALDHTELDKHSQYNSIERTISPQTEGNTYKTVVKKPKQILQLGNKSIT